MNIVNALPASPIDHVSEEVVGFRLDHQGLTMNYNFYSNSKFLGSLQTEVWPEENLLLVHRIDAFPLMKKHGTAMIEWLVNKSSETIQPVHVIGGGIGFWCKLNKLWPDRVKSVDLRSNDYDILLERRKQL